MTEESRQIVERLRAINTEEIAFIHEREPFRFLVTVILSASNTDIAAEKSAAKLFGALPTPKDIDDADISVVEDLIRSSGLSRNKSRSIKALAHVVVTEGKIPETIPLLTKIQGIGVKTANCYLVSVLGLPGVIVDTHFARTSFRLGLSNTDDRDKCYKYIRENYPDDMWSDMSMMVNKLGRDFCHARKPDCAGCPLADLCPSRSVSA